MSGPLPLIVSERPPTLARAGVVQAELFDEFLVAVDNWSAVMSNPAAPHIPDPPDRDAVPPEIPEGDGANPFGPDAPNVRPEDWDQPQGVPMAPPPSPPSTVLEDDDFAPDEG